MTEKEAIWVLKNFDKQVTAKSDGAYQSTIGKMACDMAISALEKQIPKKPTVNRYFYFCSNCGTRRSIKQKHCFCHDCGQAIDWN